MINPTTKRGVLNDWDLSYDRSSGSDKERAVEGERTGTLPFMVLDLLTDEAWKGIMQRLYRHDLEGFIWILPWVFLQFQGSVLTIDALEQWHTDDYAECARAKRNLIAELDESEDIATMSWKAEWELATSLILWLQREAANRSHRRKRKPPPLPPKNVFNSFYDALCDAQEYYEPLKNVMQELKLARVE